MIKWTTQQQQAITSAGKDVLVTASAGTGKTAVLAERCANILAGSADPTDISQILVLTFTNAAADQMQARIAENLRDRFQKDRTSYLRRQLLTLDAAHISTIHTFCKRIITENFHMLGIDPTFGIIEEDAQNLLKVEILAEIIDRAWQDSALAPALSTLLRSRNIQSKTSDFLHSIIACSRFLDSVVGRSEWYERAAALADAAACYSSELAQQQKQIILSKLKQCKSQLKYAQLLDKKITHTGHWTSQIQADFLGPINNCIEYLQKDDLDRCALAIRNFAKRKFINKPKDISSEEADLIKAPAKKALESFQGLADLAIINPEYEEMVAPSVSLQTKVMIELVKRFDRAYTGEKAKINCLDFADLEHLMLKLLTDSDSTCAALRERFRYIFVDEYQDINPPQQAILDRISRPDNVFVVGDVKQSIYAFRRAQPKIFLDRLKRASAEAEPRERRDASLTRLERPSAEAEPRKRPNKRVSPESSPLRVDLSGNFRSRKALLDFANTVFARIMTAPAFLVDYDEKTFLRPEFDYDPLVPTATSPDLLVQLYILNEESTDPDDNTLDEDRAPAGTNFISSTQRQAAFIADKISKMVGKETGRPKFKIYDKQTNEYRNVEYRDIVVLMRSPAHRANQYVEVFQLAGIPVTSQSQAGYFAANEITDCISLLKVLDNPQRDIELAAVLRSAFFKMTDTQLSMIRKYGDARTGKLRLSFFDCARKYSQTGPDPLLRRRLTEVLEQIDNWRLQARRLTLAEVLWRIYRDTAFLSFVQALPNGKQRKANLLKLHEKAIQFENFAAAAQPKSPGRFVAFIEKLLEQDRDWAPAESDNLTENAVRIMSIHKSKGLEFPVVFVAELNCHFNKKDSYGDCLIDDDHGLGLQIIESNVKLDTIAHEVIAEKKLDATLAEEMRILYVAITRARERLILTASEKASHCRNILAPLSILPAEPVRDWQLTSAKCHFDWLLYALANHKKMHDLFELESTADSVDDNLFAGRLLDLAELTEISDTIMRQKQAGPKPLSAGTTKISSESQQLLGRVRESLNWKYPFEDLTKLQAKTSVSKLTHGGDEFAPADLADAFDRRPGAESPDKTYNKLVGTATHLVIQNLALDRDITIDSIRAIAEKLVSKDKIAPETAEQIGFDSIMRFFQSDLGKQVVEQKDRVLREWPFTFAYSDPKLGEHSDSEFVIIQGIIDMIIKTGAGLVIIDFKTDDVTAGNAAEYAERRGYYEQMRHYAAAASEVLKQQTDCIRLYFLKAGIAIDVPSCPE